MNSTPKDLIMWVGAIPYKLWEGFANEARVRGVCKRVRVQPRGIVTGQSRCYLIHGQRVLTKVPVRVHSFQKKDGQCRYCGITREGYSQTLNICQEHNVRRAGKPIAFIYGYFPIERVWQATDEDIQNTPKRECGSLKKDGWYISGPLSEFTEPKRYTGPAYVGFRYTERVTVGE